MSRPTHESDDASRPAHRSEALTRRTLLKTLACSAGAGAAAAMGLVSGQSGAADAARLDVKDPTALKLGYVENAAQVDRRKFPAYTPGSVCENCLQLQGNPGPPYRPCDLFQGKLVSVGGWCSGWAAEI